MDLEKKTNKTVRIYGKVLETVEYEKTPLKVRISTPRKRSRIYSRRRLDNIRRTRKICVRRVLSAIEEFGNPLLVTFTFAGDASDAAYANDSLRRFQVRVRTKYPEAQSVFVPELSPKGRIHFHGLLFNVPLHLGDTMRGRRIVSHGTERKTRELAGIWREGYVDAKKTDGSIRLAYYISKYITKGGDELMFAPMRILRVSRGFPKEFYDNGSFAEILHEKYKDKEPVNVWEGKNDFLGKITKKTYYLE